LIQSGIGRLVKKIDGTWDHETGQALLDGARAYVDKDEHTGTHYFYPETDYYIYFGADAKRHPVINGVSQAWVELIGDPPPILACPTKLGTGKRFTTVGEEQDVALRDRNGHWILGRKEFAFFCKITDAAIFSLQVKERNVGDRVAASSFSAQVEGQIVTAEAEKNMPNFQVEFK
jgi:hypothetical protein